MVKTSPKGGVGHASIIVIDNSRLELWTMNFKNPLYNHPTSPIPYYCLKLALLCHMLALCPAFALTAETSCIGPRCFFSYFWPVSVSKSLSPPSTRMVKPSPKGGVGHVSKFGSCFPFSLYCMYGAATLFWTKCVPLYRCCDTLWTIVSFVCVGAATPYGRVCPLV
ncbi:hypothetical protein BDQ17DRAFT_278476 [Cyathus striatus]|nr:hypothetical protein BDQ17DRAFT_278476 [Cyathus striatus]